jgi:hypothetical protein
MVAIFDGVKPCFAFVNTALASDEASDLPELDAQTILKANELVLFFDTGHEFVKRVTDDTLHLAYTVVSLYPKPALQEPTPEDVSGPSGRSQNRGPREDKGKAGCSGNRPYPISWTTNKSALTRACNRFKARTEHILQDQQVLLWICDTFGKTSVKGSGNSLVLDLRKNVRKNSA